MKSSDKVRREAIEAALEAARARGDLAAMQRYLGELTRLAARD